MFRTPGRPVSEPSATRSRDAFPGRAQASVLIPEPVEPEPSSEPVVDDDELLRSEADGNDPALENEELPLVRADSSESVLEVDEVLPSRAVDAED